MTLSRNKYRVGFLLLSIFICIQIAAYVEKNRVKSIITQKDLLAQIQTNNPPLILDVRTPKEYNTGHIPGAVNIHYRELGDRLDEISAVKNSNIVVYCERGIRAKIAKLTLQKAGFKSILYLEGDISKWRSNKLPIKKANELSINN